MLSKRGSHEMAFAFCSPDDGTSTTDSLPVPGAAGSLCLHLPEQTVHFWGQLPGCSCWHLREGLTGGGRVCSSSVAQAPMA